MGKVGKKKLKINFSQGSKTPLLATQADSGREFEVQILDQSNNVVDITGKRLEFYVSANNEVTKVEGEIKSAEDGLFVVKAVNTQFKYAGIHKAQFNLIDEVGEKLGTQLFDIHIEPSIENGATIGRNVIVSFEIVDEVLQLLKTHEETLLEAKDVNVELEEKIAIGTQLDGELQDTTANAQQINQQATQTNNSIESNIAELVTENNEATTNISELDTKNTHAIDNIETLTTKNDQTKTNITKLESENNTANANIATLTDKNTTAEDNVAALTDQNTEATRNIASLGAENKDSITNLEALNDGVEVANTTISSLTQNNTLAKETNTTLSDTIGQADDKNTVLNTTIDEAEQADTTLKETIINANLDEYVSITDLENYSTKDHAHKLADLQEDTEHRTLTDTQIDTFGNKQDKLVAGTNITISDNTISATDKDTITTINGKTGVITKDDIVSLGIPGQDTNTTYDIATTSKNGLMSSTDKTKLDGIATGAQKNSVTSVQGRTGAVTISKSDVGLGSVNNVAISQAQVTKINELNYTRALTQTQYDELSPTEQDRTDVWYGIYKE